MVTPGSGFCCSYFCAKSKAGLVFPCGVKLDLTDQGLSVKKMSDRQTDFQQCMAVLFFMW